MRAARITEFLICRDNLFYPSWAFALPVTLLRLPYSFIESLLFSGIVRPFTDIASHCLRRAAEALHCVMGLQMQSL